MFSCPNKYLMYVWKQNNFNKCSCCNSFISNHVHTCYSLQKRLLATNVPFILEQYETELLHFKSKQNNQQSVWDFLVLCWFHTAVSQLQRRWWFWFVTIEMVIISIFNNFCWLALEKYTKYKIQPLNTHFYTQRDHKFMMFSGIQKQLSDLYS